MWSHSKIVIFAQAKLHAFQITMLCVCMPEDPDGEATKKFLRQLYPRLCDVL